MNNNWGTVIIDMEKVMLESKLYPDVYEIKGSHSLKIITLNSTLNVRGVFTSDNLYQKHNLPGEMSYKAPAGTTNRDEWES